MYARITAFCLAVLTGCSGSEVLPAPPDPDRVEELPLTSGELHAAIAAFDQAAHQGRLATLKAQLDAAGLPYTIETFQGRREPDPTGYNVIVPPAEGTSGPEILLSAHYDTVGLGDGRLAAGLVDNAASVVAMIEAARRVRGRTSSPVRLILSDQEELGLLGARAWIAEHGVDAIAAVINADVNGYGDTLMYGLNTGQQSAFLIEIVRSVCRERALSCLDFPEYPPSDDVAFAAAGAAVVSIGHQPRNEAEKLRSFLLGPPDRADDEAAIPDILRIIHSPQDTIERIEPETVAQAADVFEALVLQIDSLAASQ
jgi:hypothetical protein